MGEGIRYGCHGAVSSRSDDGIECVCIVEQCPDVGLARCGAQDKFVAVLFEVPHEVIDCAIAVSGAHIVDDEQFHVFPFVCLLRADKMYITIAG